MKLKESQIEFIIRDLNERGLVYEPLRDEIVDHICAMIEEEMESGIRFGEAYGKALKQFGAVRELDKIQQQIINNNFSKTGTMIKNYFKSAFRNIKKHKFYSIINITGLSVGIACTLLILFYILNELSYDKYNLNGNRIYRVVSHIKFGGNDTWYGVCPAPMAKAIADGIPEIEYAARFRDYGSFLVKKGDENIRENHVILADPDVFKIFTIPLIEGDKNTVLRDPNTLVISESMAEKYFGNQDPLNQLMTLNHDMNYKVSGVFKDIPKASSFHFDMMLAMSGFDESKNNAWLSNNFQTYFLLRKGADPKSAEKKINDIMIKNAGPQVEQFLGKSIEEIEKQGAKVEDIAQPLFDVHLHSTDPDIEVGFEPNGDIRYVYIFSAVDIFILVLAIINFMNLATARSADRAREVGIRKVMGSFRKYLVEQFLLESILISLSAMILAVVLANILMPYFNTLTGKSIVFPNHSPLFWSMIIPGAILIGILAGIYPAVFLSSFKPISILSGKLSKGSRSSIIRSSLVIFQFTISIILIIGTVAVYHQLNYIQHYKLGFNKKEVISIDNAYSLGKHTEAFKNEVLKDPEIVSATVSSYLPVSRSNFNNTSFWKKGNRTAESSVNMQSWIVDYDYINTLGMKIVEGRNFSRDFPSDSLGIILNERAAKLFGYENPIGQEIQVFNGTANGSINENNVITYHIIGIVKDFNWRSLHENIGSLCMHLGDDPGKISFRFNAAHASGVVRLLKATWDQYHTGQPFDYFFLDDAFSNMYQSEVRTGKVFTTFASLAIIIACLGLFALSSFMAEQRTKEIGVRKVMGATIGNIVFLLSRDFTKLVLIAFIISIPVAWYGIHLWLESFAYKTVPGLRLYITAGFGAILIAWITVSYQSFKAAATNPANALRDQ